MSLTVSCPNGHRLKVKESLAGSEVKCPKCAARFLVEDPGDAGAESVFQAVKVPSTTASRTLPVEPKPRTPLMQNMIAMGAGGVIFGLVIASGILFLLKKSTTVEGGSRETAVQQQSETEPNSSVTGADAAPEGNAAASATVQSSSNPSRGSDDSPIRPRQRRDANDGTMKSKMIGSIPVLTLPYTANNFAIHPETGDLAVVCIEKSTLALYSPEALDGKAAPIVAPITLRTQQVSMAFKQVGAESQLLVSAVPSDVVLVFNARDLKPGPSITTKSGHMFLNAASGRNCPFVIGIANNEITCFRFPGGQSTMLQNGGSSDMHLSANGTFLYGREPSRAGTWSATRLVTLNPENGFPTMLTTTHPDLQDNRYPLPFVSDSDEVVVASGKLVFNADMTEKLGEFEFDVQDFVANQPLAIGLDKGQLCAGSLNTFKTCGRVSPPADVLPPGLLLEDQTSREYNQAWSQHLLHGQGSFNLFIRADADRSRVLVCHRDKIAIVPLALFTPPDEVLVAAEIRSPGIVMSGQSITVEATPRSTDVQVTLTNPPAGAVQDGTKLTWTPTEQQAGETVLIYEVSSGDHKINQKHYLEVTTPHVDGPDDIPVRHIAINPDGQDAVAWSIADPDKVLPRRLLLADLINNSVLASRLFHWESIDGAAVDQHFVYVASGKHLMALKREDLTTVKDWELESPVTDVRSAAGKYLVVNGGAFVCSVPELQPTTDIVQPFARTNPRILSPNYAWMLNGFAMDSKLENRLFLPASQSPITHFDGRTGANPWSRDARTYPFDNSIEYLTELAETGIVLVHPSGRNVRPRARQNSEIVKYQVITPFNKTVIREMHCGRHTMVAYERSPHGVIQSCQVSAAIGRVAVVESGDIYSFSTETLVDPAGGALRVVPMQAKLELDAGPVTELEYQVLGGTAPYTTTLAEFPLPEIKPVVSDGGKVLIKLDHEPLETAFAAVTAQMFKASVADLREMAFNNTDQKKLQKLLEIRLELWMEQYSQSAQEQFTRVTGANSEGIHIPMILRLVVTDSQGASAHFAHSIYSTDIKDAVQKSIDQVMKQPFY